MSLEEWKFVQSGMFLAAAHDDGLAEHRLPELEPLGPFSKSPNAMPRSGPDPCMKLSRLLGPRERLNKRT